MYNAYNYNPYMNNRYMQQPTQMEQPMQPINNAYKLQGKLVDSIETARSSEYILDGSTSYFPLTNGEAIISKQMMVDGTPKITVYRPIIEEKEQIKYITQDDLKKSLNELDLSELDDIKDEIKDIKQELKDLKKKGKINNE